MSLKVLYVGVDIVLLEGHVHLHLFYVMKFTPVILEVACCVPGLLSKHSTKSICFLFFHIYQLEHPWLEFKVHMRTML